MLSQAEAVRQVLDEGIVRPALVVEAVREKFGLEVKEAFVSVIKYGWKQRRERPAAKAC